MGARRHLGGFPTNYYHVMSRVVDRRFVFGDVEKRHFRHLMRRMLAFNGLRLVTFCLMDNHFHLLVEERSEEGAAFKQRATEKDIFERIIALYDPPDVAKIRAEVALLSGHHSGKTTTASQEEPNPLPLLERTDPAAEYLRTFLTRMYDLPVFMKELKSMFTQWYNRRNDRQGTLWESRYKSVLCEGAGQVLAMMAAYIDLNPVRAGIVHDPKDYHWSGYGEAVADEALAQEGLLIAIGGFLSKEGGWTSAQALYRQLLYGVGERSSASADFSEDDVAAVAAAEGILSKAALLRCRIRYLSDGFAIGRKAFLEEVFAKNRTHFGSRRKSGARRIKGGNWGDIMAMRDLGEPPQD